VLFKFEVGAVFHQQEPIDCSSKHFPYSVLPCHASASAGTSASESAGSSLHFWEVYLMLSLLGLAMLPGESCNCWQSWLTAALPLPEKHCCLVERCGHSWAGQGKCKS